jgi:hypothetical protein
MDIRFALVEMPMAQLIMDDQRDGWRENPDETVPRWPIVNRVEAETPQPPKPHRASAWRSLPGVAAVSRLLSVPRQL